MLKVLQADKNGIGEKLGIKKGDVLTAVNGQPLVDILDYEYYDSQERFTLTVLRGEEKKDIEVEKEDYESLALTTKVLL